MARTATVWPTDYLPQLPGGVWASTVGEITMIWLIGRRLVAASVKFDPLVDQAALIFTNLSPDEISGRETGRAASRN